LIKKFTLGYVLIFCVATHLFAMEQKQTNPNWHWYITYLNFSVQTKSLTYSVTSFDPTVRVFDGETHELIFNLQRITNEGKNTNLSNEGISVEAYAIKTSAQPDQMQFDIKDQGKKILPMFIGGAENKLESYDAAGRPDLKIKISGGLLVNSTGLMRLTPSRVFEGKPRDFF